MPGFIRDSGGALACGRTVSLALAAIALLGFTSPQRATAQGLQTGRQIVLIVPFAAGGPTDIVARGAAQRLGDRLKTSVVVENKPGSAGAIGAQALARAEPDGHTIGIISAPLAQNQAIYKSPGYVLDRDFVPLALLATAPTVLVGKSGLPFKTMTDLFDYVKANPGKLSVGSASPPQIAYLKSATRLEVNAVPYRGSAQILTDVLGGQIDLGFMPYNDAAPHLESGKVVPLFTTALKRLKQVPEMAAVAEHVPGFTFQTWFGVGAPAKTPASIVSKLAKELIEIASSDEYRTFLQNSNIEAAEDPAQFDKVIKDEVAIWTKLVTDGVIPQQ